MTQKQSNKSRSSLSRLWLWGLHACQAALRNPRRKYTQLFITEGTLKILNLSLFPEKMELLDASSLSRLLPEGAVHQGIAMDVDPLEDSSFHDLAACEKGIVVVLDHVTDPHNVGAILRTAKALGALGIIMTERNAPPLSGVLAKAASGALDLLPVWKVTNLARTLEELKEIGFWTIGLDEKASHSIAEKIYPSKVALVMGAEGEGLRRLTQEKCDFLANLPTDPTFPTLNVSVAAALALYALRPEGSI